MSASNEPERNKVSFLKSLPDLVAAGQSNSQQNVPRDATKSRRVGITVGIFLMFFSVAFTSTLLVIGGSLVFRNARAAFWKSTSGELLEARVDAKHVAAGQTQTPDVPVVKYRFTVNDRTIISDKWSPAGYGMDIFGHVKALNSEKPLKVYYNPSSPTDCAVVLPTLHIGFLPFVLGLGFFFLLVVAISGGALFAALHPELAADPNCPARKWIGVNVRLGLALSLSSLSGLLTMLLNNPGGWWQWSVAGCAVVYALTTRRA